MNQKELFLITVGVFLTIVVWVIADIYHVAKTRQVKVKFNVVKPIKVKINDKVFKELEKKVF